VWCVVKGKSMMDGVASYKGLRCGGGALLATTYHSSQPLGCVCINMALLEFFLYVVAYCTLPTLSRRRILQCGDKGSLALSTIWPVVGLATTPVRLFPTAGSCQLARNS
jgi:hypothetical protein